MELSYALAGAGSRAAAYFLDILMMSLVSWLVQNLLFALLMPVFAQGQMWFMALLGILSFALFNSYFILFEWLMNGQTPGKRLVGIRVIKQGGYGLQFLDTLLRNLMRIVDFLPLFYGIGLVSLIVTPRTQRLGDWAAGTLVVHQQAIRTDVLVPELPPLPAGMAPLAAAQLAALPRELVDACVEFFQFLPELAPRYRQEIGMELVDLVRRTSGLTIERTQSAEAFLTSVILQSGQTAASFVGPMEAAPVPS